TGCEVTIPKVTEATALGGAMAAGVGVGVYDTLEDAAEKLVVWDKKYMPNRNNKEVYDKLKKKWQKAYEVQLGLVDSGVTQSMWMAPGLM
ncbi:autoinducer-2 kinase, partial [Sulfurimonas sp. NWX79]